ncbi:MAG: RNA polymerase sigma-70 factor [Bacteroides sp.]|jgi:RNA polymerase sigma-70 factor (ECF subfamily)|nr:RNA polymerase sigma-70 factor [Bacteroides sp.]
MLLRKSTREREFELLFKDNYNKLYAYAQILIDRREEARDIVSGVFADLWAHFDAVDTTKTLTPLLYKLVYNRCVDYLRHQKAAFSYLEFLKQEDGPVGSYELLEYDDRLEEAIEAMNDLPPRARDVFHKCVMEDRTYREVAEEMHVSINTIKTQMLRALKILRSKVMLNKC